jgi:hypothetical protein
MMAMYNKITSAKLFDHSQNRSLCNIFSDGHKELDNEQQKDLLKIEDEGKRRMLTYIRQYILDPPKEVRQKRIRKKLKTFSRPKATLRAQQSKVSRLTKMTKSLATRLQQSGQFYDRVLEYPLAISDEFGQMRPRSKSAFKNVFLNIPALSDIFSTILPFNPSFKDTEIILDGLKFIHVPPTTNITTYSQYAQYMFKKMAIEHGFSRGACCVTIVFDKPDFLPKIRAAVHEERKRGKTAFICPSTIQDDALIPLGQQYVEALNDRKFKGLLLDYITVSFTVLAEMYLSPNQQLILDSPIHGETPVSTTYGRSYAVQDRKNNKGEADSGVYWHCKCSTCPQIIIHAGDTDIYMIGIALSSEGHFQNKHVVVERMMNAEYVDITKAVSSLSLLPQFQSLPQPQVAGMLVLAIFLLSGSDYVSAFFRVTNEYIFHVFLKYIHFICQEEDPLVILDSNQKFKGLSSASFLRLMCCAYLEKHATLYNQFYSSPTDLWDALQLPGTQQSRSMKSLLEWLQYDIKGEITINTAASFADLTRRVCFFDCKGKADLFKLILPSDSALKLHSLRAEHAMQIVMESCQSHCDTFEKPNGGWLYKGGKISISWEDNINQIKKELRYKKPSLVNRCSCKDCSGKAGCSQCAKACKPCTAKCKCKGEICFNPHKDGGTCPKCNSQNTGDNTTSQSSEATPKDIPEQPQHNGEENTNEGGDIDDASSEDEDEEDENDVDDNKEDDILDFNEFFGSNDYEGLLELAPVATLYDDDLEENYCATTD